MNIFNLSANPLCVNLVSSCLLFSFQITYFSDNSVNFHSVKFNVFLQSLQTDYIKVYRICLPQEVRA